MDASHGSPSSSSLQIVNCLRRQDGQCLNLVELSACVSWTEVQDKKKRRGLLSSGWWWTNAERSPHCCFNSVPFILAHFSSFTHLLILQQWTGQAVDRHCTELPSFTIFLSYLWFIFLIKKTGAFLFIYRSLGAFVCLCTWKSGKTGSSTKAANWRFQSFT